MLGTTTCTAPPLLAGVKRPVQRQTITTLALMALDMSGRNGLTIACKWLITMILYRPRAQALCKPEHSFAPM
jgi:hypothetical protein